MTDSIIRLQSSQNLSISIDANGNLILSNDEGTVVMSAGMISLVFETWRVRGKQDQQKLAPLPVVFLR